MPLANRSTSEAVPTEVLGPTPRRKTGRESPELAIVWLPGARRYGETWDLQRRLLEERIRGDRPDTLLLLEHAPVVTVGRNAKQANLVAPESLLAARGVDLVRTDRGGDVTYHAPGQLVGYPIVDLKFLHNDIHRFLREIEEGIIRTVARWGIHAGRIAGKTGVWAGEEKLASIGLKASHWVTMHGLALNVSTDLSGFDLIVPCGIPGCRMTSMARLTGSQVDLRAVGDRLSEELAGIWGRAATSREGV
jgi:lipoate-protein ligase B